MDLTTYLNPDIIASIQTGGYIIMLGLMIVEGPFVTFAGAFLCSTGIFSLPIVIILGFFGDVLGDILYFFSGKFAGNTKIGKKILDIKKLSKLQALIQTNLLEALIIIKFSPNLAPIGLPIIGAMGVNFYKYITIAIPLCIVLPLFFSILGYYSGYILPYIPNGNIIWYFPIIGIFGGFLAWILSKIIKKGILSFFNNDF